MPWVQTLGVVSLVRLGFESRLHCPWSVTQCKFLDSPDLVSSAVRWGRGTLSTADSANSKNTHTHTHARAGPRPVTVLPLPPFTAICWGQRALSDGLAPARLWALCPRAGPCPSTAPLCAHPLRAEAEVRTLTQGSSVSRTCVQPGWECCFARGWGGLGSGGIGGKTSDDSDP